MTAHLAARSDTIRAAEAQVEAARAALAQAEWELAQKTRQAPEDAMVVDTFFEPGEWVAAGRPSLLPPGNIKVRFYVPEEALGTLAIGDPLQPLSRGSTSRSQLHLRGGGIHTTGDLQSRDARQTRVSDRGEA